MTTSSVWGFLSRALSICFQTIGVERLSLRACLSVSKEATFQPSLWSYGGTAGTERQLWHFTTDYLFLKQWRVRLSVWLMAC